MLAEVDLVVANLASFPNQDPGDAGWAAFEDAANRAGVPIVWLDQFGRGSFQWLVEYDGDPVSNGSDRSNDTVTATATDPDHPLLAGLPPTFELVAPDAEYSWYGEFSGTTVATVTSSLDPVAGGNLAGFRPRGVDAVDVLLGSLSISTYGWPGVRRRAGRLVDAGGGAAAAQRARLRARHRRARRRGARPRRRQRRRPASSPP